MWNIVNIVKGSVACLCLSLIFSGAAQAGNQHKQAKAQRVAIHVFDTTSPSFADLLNPSVNLGYDIAALFQKKNNATWTINSAFLYIPLKQQGLDVVLAFNQASPLTGWQPYLVTASTFNLNSSYFQPAILLAFYQEQISAVPEASAGVMMAIGLPLLGMLAWRRQRKDVAQSN